MFKKTENITLWGFKEIRYDDLKGNSIEYINEFIELFPTTKVIIQIRQDIVKQSKSNWLADDKSSLKYLKCTNEKLINFYNKHKSFCYLTTFEKMFNIGNLRNIFKFIGCENEFKEDLIISVLKNNLKD